MTSQLHRFLACILMVLLPLQSMAAAVLCPHAGAGAANTAETALDSTLMENCSTGATEISRGNDDSLQSDNGQRQHSCCSATAACAMCSMAISAQPTSKFTGNHEQPKPFAFPQYISFIPEGLQRPPSIPA